MRRRAVARHNRRLAVGTAIGVLGILVLSAGVAWPRTPLGRPAADDTLAVVPDSSAPSDPEPAPSASGPFTVAPSSAAPSAGSSASSAPPSPPPATTPPPVPGWTLVAFDGFSSDRLGKSRG